MVYNYYNFITLSNKIKPDAIPDHATKTHKHDPLGFKVNKLWFREGFLCGQADSAMVR